MEFLHWFLDVIWGCLHEKTCTCKFIPGWLLDFVSRLHEDWVTSYRICMKVHFMLIKYMCHSNWQTLHMCYPFQSTGSLISHECSFYVYTIPLQNFALEWNSSSGTTTRVNSPLCDLPECDILWWYLHKGEPEWTCAGTKVTMASCWHPLRETSGGLRKCRLFSQAIELPDGKVTMIVIIVSCMDNKYYNGLAMMITDIFLFICIRNISVSPRCILNFAFVHA